MPGQRDLLEIAVELAQIGLAELDVEGRFLSANSAYVAMLDTREADLLGRHWRATIHPEDHGGAQEAYRKARTEGRGYVEIRAVGNRSKIIYQALTVIPVCDERGVLTGYTCLRHNISDYKRDHDMLMLAVESAPNGLLIVDSAGLIQSANAAVETLFGYTQEELFGCTVEKLLPAGSVSLHKHPREVFSSDESAKKRAGRDVCGLRKDGVEIPVQVQLNRIKTDLGELTLCTVIDIAERVRYQKQLELAKQAAEDANRAKSDFLARMSHEIRTPMNLIMGMSALLLESPLNGQQRQHVEISYRNVRRLLRLINGILDLSKVEAGAIALEAAPFDLIEVLKESVATISSAMEQKGLAFKLVIDPAVWPYWMGDAARLQQVLLNLIGNAIKFTARGKIEVKVRPEPGPQGERGLRFEVSDTGCGVPANKAVMIFEPFQQAEGSMNRPYEGTGLGLAIARTLVQLMSGRIWVEEKPEPGSRFVFTAFFSVSTEAALSDRKSVATSAKAAGTLKDGTRVLLVEDNPENVILLRAYLENLGLALEIASNGVEAVEKRRRGEYDLVLMDIQMPIMDGYAATREIRSWERAANAARIPIVALTAHALIGAAGESLEAGCDGHITKPVERKDLVEAIAKFARRPADPPTPVPAAIAARRPAFLNNRRADLTNMRDALAAGDFSTVQNIGHNCKGIGSGYGFPAISELGSTIEKAAKALDSDGLAESFRQFERCVRAESISGSPSN